MTREKKSWQGAASWPLAGTPVVADVQASGFLAVTEEALSTIVQRLVPALHPHKIIMFGSYVYGAPTPDSDVDLLVILDTEARPVDRYLSVSRLFRQRPFPLDILVKTPHSQIIHLASYNRTCSPGSGSTPRSEAASTISAGNNGQHASRSTDDGRGVISRGKASSNILTIRDLIQCYIFQKTTVSLNTRAHG